MSIIIIVFCNNKTSTDLVSLMNYFMHIVPSLIFFSVYLSYVRFLIEKYYEIKTKKNDIFLSPTMQFFNVLIYIFLIIIIFSSLSKKKMMDIYLN